MLRKLTAYLFIVSITVLIFLPKETSAFGIGIYVPIVGSGSGTVTDIDTDDEFDYDMKYAGGFGIVLDTKVAKDGLFNYRLNLGMINGDEDREDYKYYVMDHSFGFGVLRTRFVRLWIGHQVRLAYMNYSDETSYGNYDVSGIGFGLGPVLGANFNFGPVFTAELDLGYRVSSYAGTAEYEYDSEYYYESDSADFTQTENVFFVNLSLIFRIADVFGRTSTQPDDEKPDYDQDYY